MRTARGSAALLLSLALASCTLGGLPPAPDPPDQVVTALAGTQSPGEVTPTPMSPDHLSNLVAYLSPDLGIQFNYPDGWYLQELLADQPPAVVVSSFDPVNPPPNLEWTDQTTRLTFTYEVLTAPPDSFEAWVESARQAALAAQLSIVAEERLAIAGQPAARLTMVSGSGGVLHQVLTDLGGRYYEVAVEGSLDAARPVVESIQPVMAAGLKPPDGATPTSGICSDPQADPVTLTFGLGPDLIPMAGRCLALNPSQRIRLVNQSSGPFSLEFAGYSIQLPVGSALFLDRPVGEYLAEGVHFLPMGPELWVRHTVAGVTPVATMPRPYSQYSNPELGYSLAVPSGWVVDETGRTNPNKEVRFHPVPGEPFIAYLDIGIDPRTLDAIRSQPVQDAQQMEITFAGQSGVQVLYAWGRSEMYLLYRGRVYYLITDRPTDEGVQLIVGSFAFLP